MFETIVALATPPGKSALALIRLSGDDCLALVSRVFDHDLTKIGKRTIFHGFIVDGDRKVDEVILLAYVKGKSFTGEESVEILSHGSMVIVDQIISLLLSKGARLATNGEFSSRAFLNRKIDLVQAEAINDLINAETVEAKDLFIASLTGETSKLFAPIKEELSALIGNIEVNIDYPEYEDIEVVTDERVVKTCTELIGKIDSLVRTGERNLVYKNGVNLAIIGKPNVGKSSLLNALINEDKAIVTDIAGTTRDVVEGTYDLNGVILHLFDTAGYRNARGKIEKLGVERTKRAIKNADLVVYVYDESGIDEKLLAGISDKKVIKIRNKSDLLKEAPKGEIAVSALRSDFQALLEAIAKALRLDEMKVAPSFVNVRQLALLRKMSESLAEARKDAEAKKPIDLVEVNVMSAYDAALELIGETNRTEDLTKEIFSHFCVGK